MFFRIAVLMSLMNTVLLSFHQSKVFFRIEGTLEECIEKVRVLGVYDDYKQIKS